MGIRDVAGPEIRRGFLKKKKKKKKKKATVSEPPGPFF